MTHVDFFIYSKHFDCETFISSHYFRLLANLIAFTFYLLILPTSFGSSEDDYYTLLGVEKGADSRDIRKAFKKLAVTKHPDKNKVIKFYQLVLN